jgi:hypothetical protein
MNSLDQSMNSLAQSMNSLAQGMNSLAQSMNSLAQSMNSLSSKEIYVKNLPVLPPITHYEYQFHFHDMFFSTSNMFQQWVFRLLIVKSFFAWTHMYHI